HLKLTDEEIAIELAQHVAIAATRKFLPLTNSPLREREIHSPTFLPRRLPVMNARGCDYEDNGIRAWFSDEPQLRSAGTVNLTKNALARPEPQKTHLIYP